MTIGNGIIIPTDELIFSRGVETTNHLLSLIFPHANHGAGIFSYIAVIFRGTVGTYSVDAASGY